MAQLNDSNVIKNILQDHCDEMIWYRVPRDAPGSVDLATYMFQQTRIYNASEDRVSKKVALKVSGLEFFNITRLPYFKYSIYIKVLGTQDTAVYWIIS